jgi:hypothetical protein
MGGEALFLDLVTYFGKFSSFNPFTVPCAYITPPSPIPTLTDCPINNGWFEAGIIDREAVTCHKLNV